MSTETAIEHASVALSNLATTLHAKRWQALDHTWSEWEMAEKNIRRALSSGKPSQDELNSLRLMEQQCRRLMRTFSIRMRNLREDVTSLHAVQSRLHFTSKLLVS